MIHTIINLHYPELFRIRVANSSFVQVAGVKLNSAFHKL